MYAFNPVCLDGLAELGHDLGRGLCEGFHLAAVEQGNDHAVPALVCGIVLLYHFQYVPPHHGTEYHVIRCALGMDFRGAANDVIGYVAQLVCHLNALHGAGIEEDEFHVWEGFQYASEGGDVHLESGVAGGVLSVVNADAPFLWHPSASVGPKDKAIVLCGKLCGDFLQGSLHYGAVRADLVLGIGFPLHKALFGGYVIDDRQGGVVHIDNQIGVLGYVAISLSNLVNVVGGESVQGVFRHHVDNDGALGFHCVGGRQLVFTRAEQCEDAEGV